MARDSVLHIAGFTIQRRLGTGARSMIYLAHRDGDKSEKPIALKRVIHEKPEDSRIFEQVEAEYKVARQIDHPYIRKCYDLKKVRKMMKTKELLLTMEYFDGKTMEDGNTLSLVDILLIFRMVAGGLNAMHQAGFVHCDIKPNNIMIDKSGSIKIIDLGQSCKIGTVKKRIQGTPDYIAPEQVQRKPLGPKTDVFNLGATMYWALTGHRVPTLITKHNNDMNLKSHLNVCKPPHVLRPQVPEPLSNLIMECVEELSIDRPQNMLVIISRLDTLIHSLLGDKIKTNRNAAEDSQTT